MISTTLTDAAFGHDPGRWPLPAAGSAAELWLRAVAAGGQGRYASARADLSTLARLCPTGRLGSLAASASGSFLRQQGWHGLEQLMRRNDHRAGSSPPGKHTTRIPTIAGSRDCGGR